MLSTSQASVIQGDHPLDLLIHSTSDTNRKGCLHFTISNGSEWKIYIDNLELLYATNSLHTVKTIKVYLQSFGEGTKEALNYINSQAELNKSSTTLMQDQNFNDLLDLTIIKRLNCELTKDAYESMLWVHKGQCTFWRNGNLPDGLYLPLGSDKKLSLSNITKYYQERLKVWQSLNSTFDSPHQRLYCFDYHNIMQEAVKAGRMSTQIYETLKHLLRGLSLRHISGLLKQDELKVAKFLQPYIQQGAIVLREPEPPLDKLPRIPKRTTSQGSSSISATTTSATKSVKATVVCIDDSQSMLDEMERLLAPEGYGVTKINNPLKATARLFRIKPDIILMDVTMPGIDGNQLCKALRDSELFQDTPIVMVTGNQGMINRAKSKFSGATDYITKPFDREKLLGIVEKNIMQKV